jgi:hypothetical protein
MKSYKTANEQNGHYVTHTQDAKNSRFKAEQIIQKEHLAT